MSAKKSDKKAPKKALPSVPYLSKPLKIFAEIFLSLFILFNFGFCYVTYFEGRIYPGVSVAKVNLGGKTMDEAQTLLKEKTKSLNENGPKITYNDQEINPKLEELGVSFDLDKAVLDAYSFGRKDGFIENIKKNLSIISQKPQISLATKIDQDKFNTYLGQLSKVAEKEPQDAQLKISGGQIVVIAEVIGRGLDKEKLKKDLQNFINTGQSGEINMVTSDISPKIFQDDTLDAQAQAEKYMQAAPVTVTFEDSAWAADRAEIGSWINFYPVNNKLAAGFSSDSFVNWVAKKVEIDKIDREVEDGTGRVLSEGSDGRGVDTNTLSAQIKDAVLSGTPASFALATFTVPRGQKTIFPHAMPGRYGGKYFDINLSEQTLYAFEGPTLVNQFLISSGVRSHPTPTGEFSVYSKSRVTEMKGEDYDLPNVEWVSWWSGDYSIHGTYWHHNFGTPMSHGCINASNEDAAWAYGWDDVGTPVYVHY